MPYRYNEIKNLKLIADRGVGFEDIIDAIKKHGIIHVSMHHNQEKYPKQKIIHVYCFNKVYLVPYIVEDDGTLFLKTLYPSRKATKALLAKTKYSLLDISS